MGRVAGKEKKKRRADSDVSIDGGKENGKDKKIIHMDSDIGMIKKAEKEKRNKERGKEKEKMSAKHFDQSDTTSKCSGIDDKKTRKNEKTSEKEKGKAGKKENRKEKD